MKKDFSISLLRVLCVIEVFFIHYFAGHGKEEYNWVFVNAVPTFLLLSGYLYGQKRTDILLVGGG